MADVIVMPQLGNTVESCLVTSWRVAVGDTVTPSTIIAEIETDKSSMEVPAGVAGTILALLANQGDEVPVKAPFFVVGKEGESVDDLVAPLHVDSVGVQEHSVPEEVTLILPEQDPPQFSIVPEVPTSLAATSVSPRARRTAEEAGLDLQGVMGTGPDGRVLVSDVTSALEARSEPIQGEPLVVTEVVEVQPVPQWSETITQESAPRTRAAQEYPGTASNGTGIGGRLTREDLTDVNAEPLSTNAEVEQGDPVVPASEEVVVETAPVQESPQVEQAPVTSGAKQFPGPMTEVPLKGIRKLVAERMLTSMSNHAQLSFDTSAPAAALLTLRARLKAGDESLGMQQVAIGDLVAYAAVKTAMKFPSINATLQDKVLRSFEAVHLGLAVDTPRGLLVPTIRWASTMSLREFSAEVKPVVAQAQEGSINPDLLAGATFTVTNLGAFGIESFTPILNSPQTAILGVNAITPRPVINPDGTYGVEQRIGFSLTVDHAVVDGADAARFLKALVAFITDIDVAILAEGTHNE